MCILLFDCTNTCVYAVRFYACAYLPASFVHVVRVHETCNERKEGVGRDLRAASCALLERLVLNVVLGRVVVRQLVDDVKTLEERGVDLHERRPLLRQRVLGEDRLDGALGFARTAIDALL